MTDSQAARGALLCERSRSLRLIGGFSPAPSLAFVSRLPVYMLMHFNRYIINRYLQTCQVWHCEHFELDHSFSWVCRGCIGRCLPAPPASPSKCQERPPCPQIRRLKRAPGTASVLVENHYPKSCLSLETGPVPIPCSLGQSWLPTNTWSK